MPGKTITINSTLQCPHGGKVQIITTNTRAMADSAFIATISDTFIISGCPFQIPAAVPIPSPCITVQWIVTDTRVKVNGNPSISQSSVGICLSAAQIPQGPVMIANTQQRMSSM